MVAQWRGAPGALLLQGLRRAGRGLAGKCCVLLQGSRALMIQLWLPCTIIIILMNMYIGHTYKP